MLNSKDSVNAQSTAQNNWWLLSFLWANSRKIAWILWLWFLAWTWIVYVNKSDNEPKSEWVVSEIVVSNRNEEEKVEEWFTMAKVDKKWIWVNEYMKINWMNWSFQNLVNKRTWERVMNPNKDLKFGEVYILARDEMYASRLSILIKHKNDTQLVKREWNIEQFVEEQPKNEVSKNQDKKDVKKVAEIDSKKTIPSESISSKSLIEWMLVKSVVSEYDKNIRQAFGFWGEIGWSKELLKMIASVESSTWRFLNTYEKAVSTNDPKQRVRLIEKAITEIIEEAWWAWPFQITYGWLETEIKNWANIDWNMIKWLSNLKSKVRSVLINSAIKWLSKEELLEKLIWIDVRFDVVSMWEVVQKSFLRIYNNLWRYNLSWKDRFKLALWAYNRGEWWAYNSAKSWKIWLSDDLKKRLKQIEAYTNQNAWKFASNDDRFDKVSLEEAKSNKFVVAKATFEVRWNIVKSIWLDRSISSSVKKTVSEVLDKDFERIHKSINFYTEMYKNWNPEEKRNAKLMLVKLDWFMRKYEEKRNLAILRIANEWQQNLKKVA